MKHIIFFFLLQTAGLITWFYFPFPESWKVDFNRVVFSFLKSGYYQVLNVGFLFAIFINERKSLFNMLSFVWRKRNWFSLAVFLFYLAFIVVFLFPSNIKFLYKGGIVVLSLVIAFFPKLFPKSIFSNPTRFKENEFNFQLLGKWGQLLPISNPLAGILIAGIQGSGKTWSVVYAILYRMIFKGYSGILYDFKFESSLSENFSLSHMAYRCLEEAGNKNKSKFISINFQEPRTSSRFNPIHPDFIKDRKDLAGYIETFLLNLNPEEAEKKDFWYKNTYILLMGIVVYLSNRHPSYCTLPHAFLMGMQPFDELLGALNSDAEAKGYASSAEDAFKKAPEQFTGVITSFKILLLKMIDKDICWVLGGNEVPAVVNDPENPLIVCLGNTATQKTFTSPILVMIADVLLGKMYAHGRNKSFLMIDELPQFRLSNLSDVPAVAREYRIAIIVALQDMTQLRERYKAEKADTIQNIFDNIFLGRTALKGAKYISDLMGKVEKEVTSTSKSETSTSVNTHQKEVPFITEQEAMKLETGQFVGKVLGGFFKIKLKPITAYHKGFRYQDFKPLPSTREEVDIEANFLQIEAEVAKILNPFKKDPA